MKILPLLLPVVLLCLGSRGAVPVPPTDAEAGYTRTITQRAEKIVAPLGLVDLNHLARVRSVIVQQYRDLNTIHQRRDARFKELEAAALKAGPANKGARDGARAEAAAEAKPKLDKLHGEFLGKLAAELSPGQVDQVKDGMTYGVVPLTYGVYLRMYPELTAEQKRQIMAWLVEAREIAMDGSTSDEKHAVFGKYKGRINNYLSKAGYDARKGEQNLKKSGPPKSETESN